MPYSVSPRRNDQIGLPKKIEKRSTRIPHHFATTMCPASCTSTRVIRIRTNQRMFRPTTRAPLDGGLRGLARAGVGAEHDLQVGGRLGGHGLERRPHDARDVHEADPPRQERGHRDLVGAVEHGRGGPALEARLAGQPQAGEGGLVGRLELEPAAHEVHRRPGRRRGGVAQRVADRHPHVGRPAVGQDAPVVQPGHGVHQGLGVDHDLDPLVGRRGGGPR